MTEVSTRPGELTEFGNFAVSYRNKYPNATASEVSTEYTKLLDTSEFHSLLSLTAEHFVDHYTANAPVGVPEGAKQAIEDEYEALMLTRIQLRDSHNDSIVLYKRFGECVSTDLSSIIVRLSYLRRSNPGATTRLTKVIREIKSGQKIRDLPREFIEDLYQLNNEKHNVFLTRVPEVTPDLRESAKYARNSLLRQMDPDYTHNSKISNLISTIGTWKSDAKGNLIEDSFVPNPAYIPARIIHG